MGRLRGVALLALAGAVLVPAAVRPAAAAADEGPVGFFRIAAAGGYRVEVIATSEFTAISATRRHSSVEYFNVIGTATATGIDADFGRLGRIKATFHSGHGCTGVFVGQIHFRGEEGFTHFDAHRVSGFFSGRGGCHPRETSDEMAARTAARVAPTARRCLTIYGERHWGTYEAQVGPGAFSKVNELGGGEELHLRKLHRPGTPFSASTFELRRPMIIIRTVAALGPRAGLEIEKNPLSAALTRVAAPFSGSLDLAPRLAGEPFVPRGDLEVSFPGRAGVALTGTKGGPLVDLPRAENCSRST